MLNKVLSTPIDNLVEIVKNHNNCKVSYLKNELNVQTIILDRWLVILEEFGIINVSYNGMDGIVNFIQKSSPQDLKKSTEYDVLNVNKIKEDFIKKAKMKKLTDAKIKEIWPRFISTKEDIIKNGFLDLTKKRNYTNEKTNKAWKKYREELYNF